MINYVFTQSKKPPSSSATLTCKTPKQLDPSLSSSPHYYTSPILTNSKSNQSNPNNIFKAHPIVIRIIISTTIRTIVPQGRILLFLITTQPPNRRTTLTSHIKPRDKLGLNTIRAKRSNRAIPITRTLRCTQTRNKGVQPNNLHHQ